MTPEQAKLLLSAVNADDFAKCSPEQREICQQIETHRRAILALTKRAETLATNDAGDRDCFRDICHYLASINDCLITVGERGADGE